MNNKTITFDRFVRWILGGLLALGILLIINYLSNVLLPFFIAWLLAYLLYPIVCFVQYRLHVPGRALSIIVALLFVIGVISLLLFLIIPPMIEQFEKLGELITQHLHATTKIHNFPAAVSNWAVENKEEIERFFKNKEVSDAIRQAMPKVFAVISQTANIILSVIASLITLLYMFFILLDYETLASGFIKIFPKKNRPFWRSLIDDVEHELNSYVRGQSLVALCIGILFCIGFTLIGFPMAIGMGIMIGLMSLIPYVHSLALIPIVFLSLLKAIDTGQNFWLILFSALAVFAIIQVITDMVLTPKIMGKAMGLNPAILLLSLSVWGALLGFIGLIVALPLTTLLIAYYQRYITKEDK
ncbi:MAG: AI-2E family transporter [Prevotella sp.]|mgnify:CR=1 FL=1|nr:AI-2E family transporter [Prevotella sp.]